MFRVVVTQEALMAANSAVRLPKLHHERVCFRRERASFIGILRHIFLSWVILLKSLRRIVRMCS